MINICLFIIPESDTSIQEYITLKAELYNLFSDLKNGSVSILDVKVYATFKLRKFERLLYTINTILQKTITFTGLQAEQIFSVNI